MGSQPQVVLLGDSVLMDSVASSLIDRQFPNVIRVSGTDRESGELVHSLKPDLIIYEHQAEAENPIQALLSMQPAALLLAIDLNCSQVIVLDCQLHPTRSMQELCELIKEEVKRCAQRKEVH
jgi:hypothetical protein